jgi:hypothetical protein
LTRWCRVCIERPPSRGALVPLVFSRAQCPRGQGSGRLWQDEAEGPRQVCSSNMGSDTGSTTWPWRCLRRCAAGAVKKGLDRVGSGPYISATVDAAVSRSTDGSSRRGGVAGGASLRAARAAVERSFRGGSPVRLYRAVLPLCSLTSEREERETWAALVACRFCGSGLGRDAWLRAA